MSDELLELEIPPEAEYVGTARLFLAAAGRHFDLSEESVADAKVAVSEVCADAIEAGGVSGPLHISVRTDPEALEIEVDQPGSRADLGSTREPASTEEPTLERQLRGPLLQALFPDATYEPERHHLRLSIPWELPEEPDTSH
jgi:anti-sigma regulatory factor (Ser/Thr protein kinase)